MKGVNLLRAKQFLQLTRINPFGLLPFKIYSGIISTWILGCAPWSGHKPIAVRVSTPARATQKNAGLICKNLIHYTE